MVSTCRWPMRPSPRRYIEIIVTMTTETAIDRLRRRPLAISPRRNWIRMGVSRSVSRAAVVRQDGLAPAEHAALARLVRVAADGRQRVGVVGTTASVATVTASVGAVTLVGRRVAV